MLIGARWQPLALGRPLARMRLQRVRFVGLTRAQVRLVARVGGAGPRPPMAEAAGDRYNLLVILGQFVSHFVSARISDVSVNYVVSS